jgi:hypothetical protein
MRNAGLDPDPAFFLIADPDPVPKLLGFDDQKLKKNTAVKLLKPSALTREHSALQNMKILYFFLYGICG